MAASSEFPFEFQTHKTASSSWRHHTTLVDAQSQGSGAREGRAAFAESLLVSEGEGEFRTGTLLGETHYCSEAIR